MLTIHLFWILWVIFGAFWTRGRTLLTAFNILSLVWGIVVIFVAVTLSLTVAEQFFEGRPEQRIPWGFRPNLLDRLVYPNLPEALLWLVAWRCVPSTLVLTLGAFGIASRKLCETRKVFENL